MERDPPGAVVRRRVPPEAPAPGGGDHTATRFGRRKPAVRSHIEVLVDGPVVALERFSHDVDLLVCGSRGYGPLGSVLLGGVSRRLVHRAACPVLVVPRGTERQSRRSPAPRRARPTCMSSRLSCRSVRSPRPRSSSRAGVSLRSRPCSHCAISWASRCRSSCSRPSPASFTVLHPSPSPSASAAPPRWTSRRWRGTRAPSCRPARSYASMRPAASRARRGEELDYDVLIVAVGAVPSPAVPGAITFAGPAAGRRGRRACSTDRTRRVPPARLRGPGRNDVVAAGLRARHDGRGRPPRPRGRERHAWLVTPRPSRCGCSEPPPALRCARCSTRAASRC